MTPQQEKILQIFEAKLGNDEFIKPSLLIKIGLYGSQSALAKALADGTLPSLKVSSNRTLILKSAVLEYIRKKLCCKE